MFEDGFLIISPVNVIPLFFVGVLAGYTSIFKMVKQYVDKIEKRTKKEKDVKKD